MKGVLDSMELGMLRRLDNIFERHMFKSQWKATSNLSCVGYGPAHSLLSLAFAAGSW